jgi:3',5'-nucleoside bisphosphate phosphatase
MGKGKKSAEVDLHIHSKFSDGSDTPEEIVKKAGQVKALSLTDHNNCEGFFEFMLACSRLDVDMVSGIEITSDFHGKNIHLLGYGFKMDIESAGLIREKLAPGIEDSRKRGKQLLGQIRKEGIIDRIPELDEINSEFGCPGPPVSIHHILHFCSLKSGIPYPDIRAEFGKGKKFWVEPLKENMVTYYETIELMFAVGGVTVLAHPYKLVEDLGINNFICLLNRLYDCGLFGLESFYARHNNEMTRLFVKLADERGLFKTTGSDYHGIYKNRDIGMPGMTIDDFKKFQQKILEQRTK